MVNAFAPTLTQSVNTNLNCNNLITNLSNLTIQTQQLQHNTVNMIGSSSSSDSSTNLAALPNSQSTGQINLGANQPANQLKTNSNSSGAQSTSSNGSPQTPNQLTNIPANANPSTSGNGSTLTKTLNNNTHIPVFRCPKRPNKGTEGKMFFLN